MNNAGYYDFAGFEVVERKNEFEIITEMVIKGNEQNSIEIQMLDTIKIGAIRYELRIIVELIQNAQGKDSMVRYKLKGSYKFRIRTNIGILFNNINSDNAVKVRTELINTVFTQILLYATTQKDLPEHIFQRPSNLAVLKWAKIIPSE